MYSGGGTIASVPEIIWNILSSSYDPVLWFIRVLFIYEAIIFLLLYTNDLLNCCTKDLSSDIWKIGNKCNCFQCGNTIYFNAHIDVCCLNLTAIAMAIYLYKRRNRLSRRGCGYLFIGINIVVFVLVYGLTGNIIYYTNQIMVYLWGLGLLAYAYKRGFIAEVEK